MLRINLLPSYVSQRRLTRKLVLGFVTLLIACAAVPLALYFQAHNQRIDEENQATAAEAGKAKTDALKAQAAAQRSQIAPLKAKVDYVKAVEAYNNSIVAFWNTVAQYSDPKIIYTDAQVAGTALTIKAYSPSIAEVGRYLQAMYQEPDFSTVGIDKLPGYPDALVTKYYLYGKLVGIGSAPTFSATGGTTGQTTPAPAQTTANGQKTTFGQVLTPTGSGAGATGAGLFGEVPVSVDQIVASQIPPLPPRSSASATTRGLISASSERPIRRALRLPSRPP